MLSGSVANENLCVFSSLIYFPSLSLIVHLHHSPSLPILPFFFPLLTLAYGKERLSWINSLLLKKISYLGIYLALKLPVKIHLRRQPKAFWGL